MYDFHPLLTSFPIVLIFLAVLAEILSNYKQKSFWLHFNWVTLILGFGFSLLAFITGLIASTNLGQTASETEHLIATHYSFAKLILFTYIPLILFRYLRFEKSIFSYLYFILLAFQFIFTAYTGNLGGTLVFQHGAGVTLEYPISNP